MWYNFDRPMPSPGSSGAHTPTLLPFETEDPLSQWVLRGARAPWQDESPLVSIYTIGYDTDHAEDSDSDDSDFSFGGYSVYNYSDYNDSEPKLFPMEGDFKEPDPEPAPPEFQDPFQGDCLIYTPQEPPEYPSLDAPPPRKRFVNKLEAIPEDDVLGVCDFIEDSASESSGTNISDLSLQRTVQVVYRSGFDGSGTACTIYTVGSSITEEEEVTDGPERRTICSMCGGLGRKLQRAKQKLARGLEKVSPKKVLGRAQSIKNKIRRKEA
ncbi:uncharacterized protein F4822DRAFT_407580 [Hypoxylon trugodes]|uniref:uncharacterized protein n=1 Tax=Hypoxylon trugodes TaxID=326681 RepID=UPI00219E3714|nr:uncharacterized protein F4822DRAFT_407580 [Hypoxylon trugodes]KAI1387786.1 hypothetical protein F4822DRAFT_407580 [Hypoxylon trugodes]